MKKLFVLFLVCFVSFTGLQAQELTILKVSEDGVAQADGKVLKAGDTIEKDAKIKFSDKDAFIRVFDGKDAFEITKKGTVIDTAAVVLTTKRAVITSKADLKKFIETPNLLVIDEIVFNIPESVYKLSVWTEEEEPAGAFFFISYEYEGEEINKFLKVQTPNAFVLDDKIYTIDGKPIDPKKVKDMEFRYAVDYETDIVAGTGLSMICISTEDIKEEVGLMVANTSINRIQQVQKYLIKFYGEPEIKELKAWLKKEFLEKF